MNKQIVGLRKVNKLIFTHCVSLLGQRRLFVFNIRTTLSLPFQVRTIKTVCQLNVQQTDNVLLNTICYGILYIQGNAGVLMMIDVV